MIVKPETNVRRSWLLALPLLPEFTADSLGGEVEVGLGGDEAVETETGFRRVRIAIRMESARSGGLDYTELRCDLAIQLHGRRQEEGSLGAEVSSTETR